MAKVSRLTARVHNRYRLGRKWGNLRLQTKGILVLSIPLLALMANIAGMRILLLRQRDAQAWVMHTLAVRVSLQNVLANTAWMEVKAAQYAAGHQPSDLEEVQRTRSAIAEAIQHFASLTVDNPRQQVRARALNDSVNLLSNALLNRTSEADSSEHWSQYKQFLNITKAMDQEEAALEQGRTQRLDSLHRSLAVLTPIAWTLGIVGAIAGMWLFIAGIARRVATLRKEVEALAQGETVSDADGFTDEIGRAFFDLKRASDLLRQRHRAIVREIVRREKVQQELVEQRNRAERANKVKSAFLAAMSHEIRTPMNAILGMAELLAESELNSEQMRYVEVFRRAGSNLLLLINDILDLSKIESGNFELESVPFDLRETVDRTLDLLRSKAAAKGLSVDCHISPKLPTNLLGDPLRLQQVLLNLLGNAMKFTAAGSVDLRIAPHSSGRDGLIEFTVTDSGIGIPKDKLETIFEEFTQVDASTTRQYGGTGLGLGIAKRLVNLMGGTVEVESVVGEGSTFRFTAQLKAASGIDTKPAGGPADLRGHRVLVVDDDETNRLICREALQSWGLEVVECASESEALSSLRKAKEDRKMFSLLLLDGNLPGSHGFHSIQQLRAIDSSLPTVVLTSDNRPGEAAQYRQMGVRQYAVKPILRSELLRVVCDALRVEPAVKSRVGESEEFRDQKLRILIAEDSADNRFLLQRYFHKTANEITFAENGERAVALFQQQSFDLILMDIQMPKMDGLSATRAIRSFESQQQRECVPILALTANGLASDRQVSEEAGCNDHLTKPISRQQLLSAIQKYRRRASPVCKSEGKLLVEIPEDLQDIVPAYLEKRKQDAQTLAALLAASDFSGIQQLAHNMKGTGSSYGFGELTDLGAEMEQAAKTSDAVALGVQLESLSRYLERVQLSSKK